MSFVRVYNDHVGNEEVRAKIQQALGPHEDLLTIVKRCKLQWHGHVSRSSGLAKTILQGTVKGERRQGRHKKRWEDNIKERTGLEFARSPRAVENREKWRKLVVKSSVVPHRPQWLRNRWWWKSLGRGSFGQKYEGWGSGKVVFNNRWSLNGVLFYRELCCVALCWLP